MMKRAKYLLPALLLLILIGCSSKINIETLKSEYEQLLNIYYFNYPEIRNQKDFEGFLKYVKSNNYEGFDYLKNNENYYRLSYNEDEENVRIIVDDFFNTTVDINLKDIGRPKWCENGISVKGFFSKDYEKVSKGYLGKIHKFLSNSFQQNVSITSFAGNSIGSNNPKAVYIYQNNKLELHCSMNVGDGKVLEDIQKQLSMFFEKNKREIPFDYALLPVSIKDTIMIKKD